MNIFSTYQELFSLLNTIIMVNPKDLRIGNKLAFIREGLATDFVTVCEISASTYWVEIDDRAQSKLEGGSDPIPLNQDILGRCGFNIVNQVGDDQGYYNENLLAGLYSAGDGYTLITEEGLDLTAKAHIKYLHQLQNLYASLTANELEVNLKFE